MVTRRRFPLATPKIGAWEKIRGAGPKRSFRRPAPGATPRTRPEERPRKLTRRSASPRGNVFRMMASVSRAGMSSRRADAAPDTLEHCVRRAHTQSYCNYHTRTHRAMFRCKISREFERRPAPHFDLYLGSFYPISHTRTLQGLQMETITATELFC